jgi:hydrogenase expression/formation protein HypC
MPIAQRRSAEQLNNRKWRIDENDCGPFSIFNFRNERFDTCLSLGDKKAMCLAVPGKLIEVTETDPVRRSGRVDFGGVIRDVSLAYLPEAKVDDYVIVHVGFALSVLDREEAEKTLADLAAVAAAAGIEGLA